MLTTYLSLFLPAENFSGIAICFFLMRIQVHYNGKEWKFFARSLKPAMPHKVSHIDSYLPKACPKDSTFILDSEILMVNVKTGKLLPFTSLGVHKRKVSNTILIVLYIFL